MIATPNNIYYFELHNRDKKKRMGKEVETIKNVAILGLPWAFLQEYLIFYAFIADILT